jgi:hypothetical protein
VGARPIVAGSHGHTPRRPPPEGGERSRSEPRRNHDRAPAYGWSPRSRGLGFRKFTAAPSAANYPSNRSDVRRILYPGVSLVYGAGLRVTAPAIVHDFRSRAGAPTECFRASRGPRRDAQACEARADAGRRRRGAAEEVGSGAAPEGPGASAPFAGSRSFLWHDGSRRRSDSRLRAVYPTRQLSSCTPPPQAAGRMAERPVPAEQSREECVHATQRNRVRSSSRPASGPKGRVTAAATVPCGGSACPALVACTRPAPPAPSQQRETAAVRPVPQPLNLARPLARRKRQPRSTIGGRFEIVGSAGHQLVLKQDRWASHTCRRQKCAPSAQLLLITHCI